MYESHEGPMREVSEQEFTAHLEETYRDANGVAKVFTEGIARREEALKELEREAASAEDLARRVHRDPVGTLRERGLLGPFDELQIELGHAGLDGRFLWPFPCFWLCRPIFDVERKWICMDVHGLKWCYPTLRLRLRWECRFECL